MRWRQRNFTACSETCNCLGAVMEIYHQISYIAQVVKQGIRKWGYWEIKRELSATHAPRQTSNGAEKDKTKHAPRRGTPADTGKQPGQRTKDTDRIRRAPLAPVSAWGTTLAPARRLKTSNETAQERGTRWQKTRQCFPTAPSSPPPGPALPLTELPRAPTLPLTELPRAPALPLTELPRPRARPSPSQSSPGPRHSPSQSSPGPGPGPGPSPHRAPPAPRPGRLPSARPRSYLAAAAAAAAAGAPVPGPGTSRPRACSPLVWWPSCRPGRKPHVPRSSGLVVRRTASRPLLAAPPWR